MMYVKVCLHMFFTPKNEINKIKHSESLSWKQNKQKNKTKQQQQQQQQQQNTICV